jgi:hypothetical protein
MKRYPLVLLMLICFAAEAQTNTATTSPADHCELDIVINALKLSEAEEHFLKNLKQDLQWKDLEQQFRERRTARLRAQSDPAAPPDENTLSLRDQESRAKHALTIFEQEARNADQLLQAARVMLQKAEADYDRLHPPKPGLQWLSTSSVKLPTSVGEAVVGRVLGKPCVRVRQQPNVSLLMWHRVSRGDTAGATTRAATDLATCREGTLEACWFSGDHLFRIIEVDMDDVPTDLFFEAVARSTTEDKPQPRALKFGPTTSQGEK